MPLPIPPETVAQIHALRAKGLSVEEIRQAVGVHKATVRRYLGLEPRPPKVATFRETGPLFDPRWDDAPDMPLTARLCGDPLPGRRELVAKNRGRENLRLVDLDED